MNYRVFKVYLMVCKKLNINPTWEGVKRFNKIVKG